MLLEHWSGYRVVEPPQEDLGYKTSDASALVRKLGEILPQSISDSLEDAIVRGSIGLKKEGFYKRINKFLWQTYGIQFEGDNDILKKGIDTLLIDKIDVTLHLKQSRCAWKPGQFGDSDSCYFGGYSIARLHWNSLPNFRAIQFWKEKGDKKVPFGRALTLDSDKDIYTFPHLLVFNSYPRGSAKEALYLDYYTNCLIQQLPNAEEYTFKPVKIFNKDDGFLYINNNMANCVVHREYAGGIGECTKENARYLKQVKKSVEKFKEYLGKCFICSNVVTSDLPHAFDDSGRAVKYTCHNCTANRTSRKRVLQGVTYLDMDGHTLEYVNPLEEKQELLFV